MTPWRWIYESEIDLTVERWIAHRLGWHTKACHGASRCDPFAGPDWPTGHRTALRGRWHRWIR
jgi:hypothetical protein